MVGARDVTVVYETTIELARRTLVEYFTNSSMLNLATVAGYNFVEIEIQSVQRIRRYNRYGYNWVDSTIICYYTQTAIVTVPDNQNLMNQPLEHASAAGGGGGASIDMTEVVAALNDIALRDVDYQANNGGAIFSMRGKVRNE